MPHAALSTLLLLSLAAATVAGKPPLPRPRGRRLSAPTAPPALRSDHPTRILSGFREPGPGHRPIRFRPVCIFSTDPQDDCPSSIWVQFQGSCYTFLQVTTNMESIEDVRNQCTGYGADMVSIHNEEENAFILDILQKQWKGPDDLLLGMFYDTDDASFKWFDKSNMTFDKWVDEDGEDLVDTCGFLYTKTGEWKKGNCEISSVKGTLCKAAIAYDKKYLSDNHILVSTLVIAGTVTLTVLGAIIWFLYKRNACSAFSTFPTAPQSPYSDGCALVVEDDEYAVQLD